MSVIDIEELIPHEICIVQCTECWKRHVSQHPVNAKFPLECFKCHAMACIKTGESLRGVR